MVVDDENQQYEWCSQESDEDSNYGGEVDENADQNEENIQTSKNDSS
jgi:hypothetical protein